jgi:superfamily II DNA helicase RecQ
LVWTNCKFWQKSNDNENILHSLVDDLIEEDGSKELTHFWDENIANHSILQSLIEEDVKVSSDLTENEDEVIWEAEESALSLIDIETEKDAANSKDKSYIWNDLETINSLLRTNDDKEFKPNKNQDLFPWEDPNYIKCYSIMKSSLISFAFQMKKMNSSQVIIKQATIARK